MASSLYRFPPKTDCPYWLGEDKGCDILTGVICRTVGECGFYPPTENRRILKVRVRRAEMLPKNIGLASNPDPPELPENHVFICSECAESICEGDTYLEFFGEQYCERCIDRHSFTAVSEASEIPLF